MPKTRTERLVSEAVAGGDPIAVARKLKRAASNPGYAQALVRRGQHLRAQSRRAQAMAEKLRDRELIEANARRMGQRMLAEAEARQAELERVADIVKSYDAKAKEVEAAQRQKDADAVKRYFPQVGTREEF